MFAKIVAFKVRLMLLIALILLGYNAQPAQAFNAADYQGLADATSSATIPPGTTITVENWQQYKQFIPVSLQWLYGGKYPWKVPSGADYAIGIGPTVSIPVTHLAGYFETDRVGHRAAGLVGKSVGPEVLGRCVVKRCDDIEVLQPGP